MKGDEVNRAIFSNGAFVEGWATYAEQIMVEQFQRDGIAPVSPSADGSYELP